MPKLTRYTSFSNLKAGASFNGYAAAINKQAHAWLEAFLNDLKAAATKEKAVKGHGK